MSMKLASLQQSKGPINGNIGSEDSDQFRLYVKQLKDQTESDRQKMTEALSRWADEVHYSHHSYKQLL